MRNNRRQAIWLVVIFFISLWPTWFFGLSGSATAWAGKGTGSIKGYIFNAATMKPIPEIEVMFTYSGGDDFVLTDSDGFYEIELKHSEGYLNIPAKEFTSFIFLICWKDALVTV